MTVATQLHPHRGSELHAEQEQLQGIWVSIAGRRPMELFVAGNRFTMHFLDGDLYMGTLELQPDESPQTMLMRIEEGPAKHRGKLAWCIYEMEGDLLRWCPAEPGSGERMIAFPDVTDRRYLCTVLRREISQREKDQ